MTYNVFGGTLNLAQFNSIHDQATAIGNMHSKLEVLVWLLRFASVQTRTDRQTDSHTIGLHILTPQSVSLYRGRVIINFLEYRAFTAQHEHQKICGNFPHDERINDTNEVVYERLARCR